MTTISDDYINILWTGGWDSTFQLLQLALIQKKPVIPYYLIDDNRRSTKVEMKTMEMIRSKITSESNDSDICIEDIQFFKVNEIPEDMAITVAYNNLLAHNFMGSQYEWLARFCKANDISELQLCIHKDDKAFQVIKNNICPSEDNPNIFQVDDNYKGTDEFTVFGAFTFPVLNLSKLEMKSIAKQQQLDHIMALTWFCHKPTQHHKPCGKCNPCLYTIQEGLGSRIPFANRLKGKLKLWRKSLG